MRSSAALSRRIRGAAQAPQSSSCDSSRLTRARVARLRTYHRRGRARPPYRSSGDGPAQLRRLERNWSSCWSRACLPCAFLFLERRSAESIPTKASRRRARAEALRGGAGGSRGSGARERSRVGLHEGVVCWWAALPPRGGVRPPPPRFLRPPAPPAGGGAGRAANVKRIWPKKALCRPCFSR
jgi:hypothetical protein